MELLSSLSINSHLTPTEIDSLNYWDYRIANGDTTYHARLQRGTFLAPAYVYNKQNVPIIAVRLTQGNSKINGLMWADMRKIGFDCTAGLSGYKNPALIIQGEEDVVDRHLAYKAAKAIPNSKVVFLEHCGHYGWLDNKEKYLKEINAFLSTLPL
jgi:proline iminopeptidase